MMIVTLSKLPKRAQRVARKSARFALMGGKTKKQLYVVIIDTRAIVEGKVQTADTFKRT